MTNIERTSKHIDKYLGSDVNMGRVYIEQNDRAYYITPKSNMGKANLARAIKQLPSHLGHFECISGEHIFGPNETPEEKLSFAEVCASATGQVLVKHKEETLRLMGEFSTTLKNMAEIKKEHNLEYNP